MSSYKCSICEIKSSYSEKHDAYYCKKCNKWLEKGCKDKTCEFCSKRPKTPLRGKE